MSKFVGIWNIYIYKYRKITSTVRAFSIFAICPPCQSPKMEVGNCDMTKLAISVESDRLDISIFTQTKGSNKHANINLDGEDGY